MAESVPYHPWDRYIYPHEFRLFLCYMYRIWYKNPSFVMGILAVPRWHPFKSDNLYWHCGSSTLERRPTWKDGLGCGTGWRWGVFLGSLLLVEEIFHLAGMCKTSHIWSKLKYCKVDIYLLLGKFYITWYMLDFVHPRWWRIVWRDDWGIRFPPSAWIFGTFTLMDLFKVVFLLFTMVNDH